MAVAQQWERGKFDLDDAVARYIPEFGNRGKEAITIRHVLTHRGGFRMADGGNRSLTRAMADNLKEIYQAELEPGWIPGKKAGYHPTSGWFILGELVQRASGKPFSRYVREEIFLPLGMQDCWVGMPTERFRAYGTRIGWMHSTPRGGEVRPTPIPNSEAFNTDCSPGAGGRGPMRESSTACRVRCQTVSACLIWPTLSISIWGWRKKANRASRANCLKLDDEHSQ